MDKQRESSRIKDVQHRRILDEAARKRRQRKALDALESDNFQDDPHADLKMSRKAPKFEENLDAGKRQYRKRKSEQRFRKNFAGILEDEQMLNKEGPNYFGAVVPPSKFPERHFCSVCGFPSNYTCISCGTRFCSVKCLGTHQDTRCLKYTA